MLCHAPAKPRKQQRLQELVCRESERGGGGREGGAGLNRKTVNGGMGEGGILWEGSQSNYRQRCSPGFFGGTKFTFQRSLPPSPSTFLLPLLSPTVSATLFSYFLSSWLPCTLHPPFPHLSVSLSWLHERYRTVSPAKHQISSP